MFATDDCGMNYNRYYNEFVEERFYEAKFSLDEELRSSVWHDMQVAFADDVGWIMVCEPGYYLPVTTELSGGIWTPLNGFDFRHAVLNRTDA